MKAPTVTMSIRLPVPLAAILHERGKVHGLSGTLYLRSIAIDETTGQSNRDIQEKLERLEVVNARLLDALGKATVALLAQMGADVEEAKAWVKTDLMMHRG